MEKNKVDYSIEFAHIYTNESYSREHFDAAWIASQKINELVKQGYSVSSNILIDDYNPSEDLLDVDDFINTISQHARVDNVASEADLVMWTKLLLDDIKKARIARSNVNYINKNHKVPCSFLVAVWNLIRLDAISNNIEVSKYKTSTEYSLVGERIINILPKRYEQVEQRAMDIIANSSYNEYKDRIEHIFY